MIEEQEQTSQSVSQPPQEATPEVPAEAPVQAPVPQPQQTAFAAPVQAPAQAPAEAPIQAPVPQPQQTAFAAPASAVQPPVVINIMTDNTKKRKRSVGGTIVRTIVWIVVILAIIALALYVSAWIAGMRNPDGWPIVFGEDGLISFIRGQLGI